MSDLCLSRPMLSRVLRQAELMDRMMERVGVEPVVAARVERGAAFYEARTRCIDCRSVRTCRSWLAAAKPGETVPLFCGNAAFLELCAERTRRRNG